METVYDYIKYYQNLTFEESNFNDMDNIVFCSLSYLPLNHISIKEELTLNTIYQKLRNQKDQQIVKNSIEILNQIRTTKRYKHIKISNYINILDNKTQFAALTIRFGKGNCFIAYRGTDTSIIGWKEDFELGYTYPVPAQYLAASYLKKTIKFTDKTIYVGGHSKGGNLAMTAAMEVDQNIQKKIKTIYNNDGPGFLKEEYNSKKFKRISQKIKMFIPEESIVGILLETPPNYTVIKSKNKGIKSHDLTSWICFGGFLKKGRLSIFSKELKEKINTWLQNEKPQTKEIIVENLFNIINLTGAKDFKEIKLPTVNQIINELKEIDITTKEILKNTISSIIK